MSQTFRERAAAALAFTLAALLPVGFSWSGAQALAVHVEVPPAAALRGDRPTAKALLTLLQAADDVAQAWEPPPHRALPKDSKGAKALRKLGEKLGANASSDLLTNPCVEQVGRSCALTALDGFFDALDLQASKEAARPAVISSFGNSLIAGDRIIDVLRRDLQRGFGDGGRGLLLVDRMAPYGGRERTAARANGWTPRTLADVTPAPEAFGISGVHHVSGPGGATSLFALQGERHGTLWWVDAKPKARMVLRAAGKRLGRTKPEGTGALRALTFELPEGADTLEITAESEGAVALGVTLEHARPGVVLDGLGVPSADASLVLAAANEGFLEQLRARAPSLLVFMLGGNEVKRLEWGRSTPAQVERDTEALVVALREAAPGASCLLVSPIDALVGGEGADAREMRPFLPPVVALQRAVAARQGCAFFDLHAAMGGEGSLLRLADEGLMHDDLVHPKGKGLDLLGRLLADALLFHWVQTPKVDPTKLRPAWATLFGPKGEWALHDRERLLPPPAEEALQRARLSPVFTRADLRGALVELGWVDGGGRPTRRGVLGAVALATVRGEALPQ